MEELISRHALLKVILYVLVSSVGFSSTVLDYSERHFTYLHSYPKLDGHPFSAFHDMLTQYVYSYPPYLEGTSFISNLRICHCMALYSL
jgi:hypothetical protein